MMRDCVIIGGGAAGLMCAVQTARRGKSVTLIEHMDGCGRKLAITGKGRCNVTNNCDVETVLANIPRNPRFMYSALNGFSPDDTMAFFESLGVKLKTERGNRVFPQSDNAKEIVSALVKAANERLRKLEKVFGLSQSSEIYQLMSKYKESYSKTKGKIYDQRPQYADKVRFINKEQFDKLSAEDKLYFIERINTFMSSATSTKTGIEAARSQSYKTFMKRYGSKYPNLSEEQYAAFFSTYNYNIVGDSETHFRYSEWSRVLQNIKLDEAMTDKQMDEVMSYVRSNNWVGLKSDENLSKYLLRI